MNLADVVDRVLEVPVVPSFANVGYAVRSRLGHWDDLDGHDLSGRTMLVTGGTSGLGRATARRLAGLGAHVVIVGRDPGRTLVAAAEIEEQAAGSGGRRRSGGVGALAADVGDLDQVRALADEVLAAHPQLDTVIHNAGTLATERHVTSAGHEATVATQVYGPFLLTSLLLDALGGGDAPGRVLTMSSGGMYTVAPTVDGLEMSAADYRGSRQYALAKRAQVTLNELWAARVPASHAVFHAVHPGWADTPGVEASLPRFHTVMRPLLRSADEGADTMVWLAAADEPAATSGGFWLDRRTRSTHKLPTTRRADTPRHRAELWARCVEVTGAIVP